MLMLWSIGKRYSYHSGCQLRVSWWNGTTKTNQLNPQAFWHSHSRNNSLYCAITALDGYPSHSDNIHYIQSVTLIYVLLPSMDHAIHHFHPWHSSHPPFASGWHLLTPKPSHPSHIIGWFVTGTSIMSACKKPGPTLWFHNFGDKLWNVVEPRQWRF